MCRDSASRRLAVAGFLLPLALVLLVSGQGHGKGEPTESEASPEENEQPVDWMQIWLMREMVVEVKVTLFDSKTVDDQIKWKEGQGLGIAGPRELVFETRDPIITDTFSSALFMPLRLAIPDDPGYGAGGVTYPNLGHIEVLTSEKKKIFIGINYVAFSLGSKDLRRQNQFYSWMIAQQLDDILFLKTGRHIPRDVFRSLSAEAYIESQRRNYEDIRNEARKADALKP